MGQSSQPAASDSGLRSTGTSRSLMARVKAGDDAGWTRLVDLYAPLVWHWCRRGGLQEEDAADVFQEVFQAVATHIDGFRKERPQDTFRGWLRTITQNKLRDHYRRADRQPRAAGGTEAGARLAQVPAPERPPDDEEGPAADLAAERRLFDRALAAIRGEFEDRTWGAFYGMAVDGRPAKDVALDLSMSPGAVRVAKCRVLARLREELGDQG